MAVSDELFSAFDEAIYDALQVDDPDARGQRLPIWEVHDRQFVAVLLANAACDAIEGWLDLSGHRLVPLAPVGAAGAASVLPASGQALDIGTADGAGEVVTPPLVSGLLAHPGSDADVGPGGTLGAGELDPGVEALTLGPDGGDPQADLVEGVLLVPGGYGGDGGSAAEGFGCYVGDVHAPTIDDGRAIRQPRMTLERVGWLCDKGHLHEQEDRYVAEGRGQAVYRLLGHFGRHLQEGE